MNDEIKALVEVDRIIFTKDYFSILSVVVIKNLSKSKLYEGQVITIKGTICETKVGDQYECSLKEVDDPKYGRQYLIKHFTMPYIFEKDDQIGKKKFLLSIYTERQVMAMYAALEDPFEVLNDGNLAELVKVKGCGFRTGENWISKFNRKKDYAKLFVELEIFNLSQLMIQKIYNFYDKSAELAIQKTKENPYSLCDISGIGWKTADAAALSAGIDPYGMERVTSFIQMYLEDQAKNGYTYVSPQKLMDAIVENIGEDVRDLVISDSMHYLYEKGALWYPDDKSKIALTKYVNLEHNIAKELIRIRDAESHFEYADWEEKVREKEKKQGWSYTDQQYNGIRTVLSENIVCITGKAGTGKSSLVDAMLDVFGGKYKVALAALAGRAAARLAEITGQEGKTIHKLLDFFGSDATDDEEDDDTGTPMEQEGSKKSLRKNHCGYHDENPLEYDIIIIDEISMINGQLFYYLLRAVGSGSKLILLGDIGQLESIGECKVGADIIESPEIPTVTLDKIHRQAAKSAIITDSIAMRDGNQIVEKDYVGVQVRGELQDLEVDTFLDSSETFYKVMQHFSKELEEVESIGDLQVICPRRENGGSSVWTINNAIQDLYNPSSSSKEEIVVYYSGTKTGILRVGDKVINRKNHYDVARFDSTGKFVGKGIFNGNIGYVTGFHEEYNESDDRDEKFMDVYFPETHSSASIKREYIKDFELGYAITCHSAQGSQFKHVIIALDFSAYVLLSREWVYTAVTRAQEHCTLVAQVGALRYAVATESISDKTSMLQEFLEEEAHPKFTF